MENLFDVEHLTMHFPITRGFTQRVTGYVRAVSDVSFHIEHRETLGVVGESGCGKSTTGNCLIRLLKPTSGRILYNPGQDEPLDLATLPDRELPFYRRQAQMIFQDPYSSLDPRMTIKDLVGEPLLVNHLARGSEITDRVGAVLKKVGLRAEYMKRYPHAFSGGQRQRISIARALIVDPKFVICDEAVSSLDVSVQAQIVELLRDLQTEYGNTYLFISHDLSVVRHISNRIMVMYLGQIMEMCNSDELFMNTLHPYSRALIDAIPSVDTRNSAQPSISGDPGDPSKVYGGCCFASRCQYAEELCQKEKPALRDMGAPSHEHLVNCHFAQYRPPRSQSDGNGAPA